VLSSPAVNLDETGWCTAGDARTLWTATTPDAAIFRIAQRRAMEWLRTAYLGDLSDVGWLPGRPYL
jgi:hypothetical protein